MRSLLAAGAVASLGLPLGQHAYGIGGSAIQAAYTPRESVGAAPSVSLISAGGGSSSAAASVASSGGGGGGESTTQGGGTAPTRGVSSEDEGHGTTKKRRPRKSGEEGGSTRVAKNGKKEGTTYEAKDQKDRTKEVPIIKPAPKPLITLSTGFESKYIYHGVDIVGFNSGPNSRTVTINGMSFPVAPELAFVKGIPGLSAPKSDRSSPVYYFNGNFEFQGLRLGVGYIRAINETTPQRESLQNQATVLNRLFNVLGPATHTGPSLTPFTNFQNVRKTYQEVDINLDYTLGIIANVLDATVGYNSYIFPDHDFKGTNYQGEAFGRLTYKQIPYLQPSITYFRYLSDARAQQVVFSVQNQQLLAKGQGEFVAKNLGEYLNGNYIEARLDGAIPIVNGADFALAFAPYATISVNDGYLTKQVSNSTRLEFNTVELGFKLPAVYKGRFGVTPYFNYGFDISRSHEANDFRGHISPYKEDAWGGVTFSYQF